MTGFAARRPRDPHSRRLLIRGDALREPLDLADCTSGLGETTSVADLHCVTTWSARGLTWSGVGFADFYAQKLAPHVLHPCAELLVLARGEDGWRTTLPLTDLLQPGVMIATGLDGAPLSVGHGAPLRLVAPAHYGYKSVKHLQALELWTREPDVRMPAPRFFDHPRARVQLEERVRWLPGRSVRWLVRLFIEPTVRHFAKQERATGR